MIPIDHVDALSSVPARVEVTEEMVSSAASAYEYWMMRAAAKCAAQGIMKTTPDAAMRIHKASMRAALTAALAALTTKATP